MVVEQGIGAVVHQALARGQPKSAHRAAHVFEPRHHAVLVQAFGQAGAQPPRAGGGNKGIEQHQQHQPEADEDGMVEGKEREAEQDLQRGRREIDQHGGQALLQGGHVEQAVH